MIKSIRFDTLKPGPHLVVFGAVHGDEKCGTQAIEKLIAAIEVNEIQLHKGSLTCVPIANPQAYALNRRFVERNLNRALYVKEVPQSYEDTIDPILCRILDEADVFIDLHSFASQGGAFGFLGATSDIEIAFCRHLSVNDFIYGWADAFGQVLDDPRDGMGTVEYARSKGALATTIECGHHFNDNAADIGYQVLLSGLAYFDLTHIEPQQPTSQRFVKMSSVFFKTEEGELTKPWKHYDAVKSGEILATYRSGHTIVAPQDGYIILPKLYADVGGEWFYFGIETACPKVYANKCASKSLLQ